MLTLPVPYRGAKGRFTDQAHVLKPLPPSTQTREKCKILVARGGFKLALEHSDERATDLPSTSQQSSSPASNWRIQFSPAGFEWTTRQFLQSRLKTSPSESETSEASTACRRVLDFLEAISNIIPRSSGSKRRDHSAPNTITSGENICQQGKTSRSPWHPANIMFATDFDCTCTLVDTCKILVRAAEVAALKRPEKESLLLWQPGNFHRDYKAAVKRHVERTRGTIQTLFLEHKEKEHNEKDCEETCSTESRTNSESVVVHGEDDGEQDSNVAVKAISEKVMNAVMFGVDKKPSTYKETELRMALTKLAVLEIMCNQDVVSLGVLRGPTREEIRAEASVRVRLRAHCARLLQRLAHTGSAIHVVSANWSRDLIVAGLPKLPENRLVVHSNDLVFDSEGRSLGMIDGKVVDAFDKEELLRTLRCTFDAKRSFENLENRQKCWWNGNSNMDGGVGRDSEKDPVLVFVGDSHTDLLGLLEADLGIVIGESLLMRRIMALFGVQLRPLAEASSRISVARVSNSMLSYRRSGLLFETRSWTDVEACLFGDNAQVQP